MKHVIILLTIFLTYTYSFAMYELNCQGSSINERDKTVLSGIIDRDQSLYFHYQSIDRSFLPEFLESETFKLSIHQIEQVTQDIQIRGAAQTLIRSPQIQFELQVSQNQESSDLLIMEFENPFSNEIEYLSVDLNCEVHEITFNTFNEDEYFIPTEIYEQEADFDRYNDLFYQSSLRIPSPLGQDNDLMEDLQTKACFSACHEIFDSRLAIKCQKECKTNPSGQVIL